MSGVYDGNTVSIPVLDRPIDPVEVDSVFEEDRGFGPGWSVCLRLHL